MSASAVLIAAVLAPLAARAESRTSYLDPFTMLYQTDDSREGRRIACEDGYWANANGQRQQPGDAGTCHPEKRTGRSAREKACGTHNAQRLQDKRDAIPRLRL